MIRVTRTNRASDREKRQSRPYPPTSKPLKRSLFLDLSCESYGNIATMIREPENRQSRSLPITPLADHEEIPTLFLNQESEELPFSLVQSDQSIFAEANATPPIETIWGLISRLNSISLSSEDMDRNSSPSCQPMNTGNEGDDMDLVSTPYPSPSSRS